MGIHSSIEELYSRANMVIFSITLNTRRVKNILGTIKILADFDNKIEDIIILACKFWELDHRHYQLVDEKTVTIPKTMLVQHMYKMKGGRHLLEFKMVNKHTNIFNVLKTQQEAIRIDRSGVLSGGLVLNSNRKPFKNEIKITKLNENRMDNAPESFFKRFPKIVDYINIQSIEANTAKSRTVKYKSNWKTHQRGPISFYMILLIIILQLVQLFHFDVSYIYALRSSLLNLFLISPQSQSKPSGVHKRSAQPFPQSTYFAEITSRTDFTAWLLSTVSNLYISKNSSLTPMNFFSEKCVFIGKPAIVKFQTKVGDDGKYFVEYNADTLDRAPLKGSDGQIVPWGIFRDKKELGIEYTLEGFLSDYAEGGYVLEFGAEDQYLEDVMKPLLNISDFLKYNSLAANFILGGYILDIDYFFSINLAIEKTPSGGYQPITKEVEVFRPGLDWNNKKNLILDILVGLLTIGNLIIHIMNIRKKIRKRKMSQYIKKINFVLTSLFIVTQFFYYFYVIKSRFLDNGIEFFNATGFIDVRMAAHRFKSSIRLKAINTGIAILIMSVILNHKITQKFSITILNVAIAKNIQYLMLILPVFIGLALVGGFILGPFNEDYTYPSRAIISVMLFTIGRIAPGKILKYQSIIGCIFITLIYIISVFLSFTVFIAFGLQSYYEVMAKTGYYSSSFHETTLKGMCLNYSRFSEVYSVLPP